MALIRPASAARTGQDRADRRAGDPGRDPGLGDGAQVTVKGVRATAAQRQTIDAVLTEARRLGASQRVMVAAVMAITQESGALPLTGGDRDSAGPFQQRAPWGTTAERTDPTTSARLFLTANKGHGVQGWRVVHGSLSNAPGGLPPAIQKVQLSAFPNAYAQWEAEATRTAAAWIGSDGAGLGTGRGSRRYEFTRGERGGEPESSWDAMGRVAEEVNFLRWAAGNTLHFVSAQELAKGAPSLTIRGDEPWMLTGPAWEWSPNTAVSEVTLSVLADRWGILPGGVVVLAIPGPFAGRWIVRGVSGSRLDSPVATITLARPTLRAPEPAAESEATGEGADEPGDGGSDLLSICQALSGKHPYVFGGGHGPQLDSIDEGDGLDCSSALSLALFRAGHFDGSVSLVSGTFASSWGRPGKGRTFSVYANAGHTFIAFDPPVNGIHRFDTSPHGDGPRGANIRRTPRSDLSRFTVRHWEGK